MATNAVLNLSNLLRCVQFNGNIRSNGTNSTGKSIVSSHALSSRLGSNVSTDNGDNTNNKKRSIVSSQPLSSCLGSDVSTDSGDDNNNKKDALLVLTHCQAV